MCTQDRITWKDGALPLNVCVQCGSASRDKSGFCAGCGAAWPLTIQGDPAVRRQGKQAAPYAKLAATIKSFGMVKERPKIVWAAVLFALLLGPIGLAYCTRTGAVVMLIVSIALSLFLGRMGALIVLPVCCIWAWVAARESGSLFD